MTLDEFCDIYSVARRDRLSAAKFFSQGGAVLVATEDEWIAKFEGNFLLGRAGKPNFKSLISKTFDELKEIARVANYPESEWSVLENKAKLAKYLSNK